MTNRTIEDTTGLIIDATIKKGGIILILTKEELPAGISVTTLPNKEDSDRETREVPGRNPDQEVGPQRGKKRTSQVKRRSSTSNSSSSQS